MSDDAVITRLSEVEQKLAKVRARPGRDGRDGRPGAQGAPGRDGKDGKDVDESKVDALIVEKVAEVESRIRVPADGKDGAPGFPGERGADGKDGAAGRDGANGIDGLNGKDGAPGPRGPRGPEGPIGAMPRHEWDSTLLRFEIKPGVWGEWVDLQGPAGKEGNDTRAGGDINLGPTLSGGGGNNYFPGGWT